MNKGALGQVREFKDQTEFLIVWHFFLIRLLAMCHFNDLAVRVIEQGEQSFAQDGRKTIQPTVVDNPEGNHV